MTTAPEPLTVTLTIGLDTPISDRYVQTGEDMWDTHPVTVLDAVIERMAQLLANGVSASDKALIRELRERARQRIDDVIMKAVEPIVAEALKGEVRRTNTYGESVGAPTTLRELVVEAAVKQLTPGKNPDAFSRSRTAIDEAIATTAKQVVAKELAEVVSEAKKTLHDALANSVAETMADTITKAMAR